MASRVALFDVDGVVLRGKGLNHFARYLVARGEAKPVLAMRGAWYALGHRLGWLDGGTVLRRVAGAYLAGRRAAELARQGEEWFVERGAAAIYREAAELVSDHRRAGTPVVLLSGGYGLPRRTGRAGARCSPMGRRRTGGPRRSAHRPAARAALHRRREGALGERRCARARRPARRMHVLYG